MNTQRIDYAYAVIHPDRNAIVCLGRSHREAKLSLVGYMRSQWTDYPVLGDCPNFEVDEHGHLSDDQNKAMELYCEVSGEVFHQGFVF